MCRNIKTLFNFEPPATDAEIHASALQFVRKLSGFNKPSQANEAAFDRAVEEGSAPTRRRATAPWRRRRRKNAHAFASDKGPDHALVRLCRVVFRVCVPDQRDPA